MSRDNQLEIIRDAQPLAHALFELGQRLWAPYLLGQTYVEALRYKPTPEDLGVGDPWVLTDPLQKQAHAHNPASQEELTKFWSSLADPAAALQLHQQIEEAVRQDRIRLRHGKGYKTVPWPAQYLVRYPVSFGGRKFASGELIAFYAEQVSETAVHLDVRRTGRVTTLLELLGQV